VAEEWLGRLSDRLGALGEDEAYSALSDAIIAGQADGLIELAARHMIARADVIEAEAMLRKSVQHRLQRLAEGQLVSSAGHNYPESARARGQQARR
jgi:hypothetical protein